MGQSIWKGNFKVSIFFIFHHSKEFRGLNTGAEQFYKISNTVNVTNN